MLKLTARDDAMESEEDVEDPQRPADQPDHSSDQLGQRVRGAQLGAAAHEAGDDGPA
jgi:hypothetical protein